MEEENKILWVEEIQNEDVTVTVGNNYKAKIMQGNKVIETLLPGERYFLQRETPERRGLFHRNAEQQPTDKKSVVFWSVGSLTVLWGIGTRTNNFNGKPVDIQMNGSATFRISNPLNLQNAINQATVTVDDIQDRWGFDGYIANYAMEAYEYVKWGRADNDISGIEEENDISGIKKEISELMEQSEATEGSKFVTKRRQEKRELLSAFFVDKGLILQSVTVTGFRKTSEEGNHPKVPQPELIVERPVVTPVPVPTKSGRVQCPGCKSEIDGQLRFCPICGKKM